MKKIYEKIIEKAIELCVIADEDEMIYGNSYVEFGERSIKIINPQRIKIKCKK